ncbi:MAG: hypothetical protein KIT25_13830 [Enhydrobacter sp.]|nr:MAG: hypothetical protein KIT25_13830 [Enhydrobacter sp.]
MKKKDTRFGLGNTAGVGRPEGRKNDTTLAREAMLEGLYEQAREVLQQALDKGSESAAKFVIRMVCGQPRGAVVKLDLPRTDTMAGVDEAEQVVIAAVASGELSAADALAWSALFDMRRRSIEKRDLERRVEAATRAQKENTEFAQALVATARGEDDAPEADAPVAGSSRMEKDLAAVEAAARPDLPRGQRMNIIADEILSKTDAEGVERVRAAARGVLKEQQARREREAAAAAAARPAPDAPPPPPPQPSQQQPPGS